jgi:hypothetical protein
MRKKKEEIKIELNLNHKKEYDFKFNDKINDKELKNTQQKITGELAEIFIKKGYGIVC